MAKFRSMVVTDAGRALIAQTLTDKKSVIFSSLHIGDGSYTGSEVLTGYTALKDDKNQYSVSSIQRVDSTTVKVSATVNNTGVTAGYYMNEMGIFAKEDGNTTETLIGIATASEADYLPDAASLPLTIIVETYMQIDNADSVTFSMTIPSGVYASVADLDAKVDKVNGKGLSTNDFTDDEKTALDNVGTADASSNTAAFTQAASRANLTTGEKLSVIFGKIMKWFADLKDFCFTALATDLTTNSSTQAAASSLTYTLSTSKAPNNHANSGTTYGIGTSALYGHNKLSDAVDSTLAAASGGTAATPAAVKTVNDKAVKNASDISTLNSDVAKVSAEVTYHESLFNIRDGMSLSISKTHSTSDNIPTSGYYILLTIAMWKSDGSSIQEGIQIAYGYFGTSKRYTRSWSDGSVNAWTEF